MPSRSRPLATRQVFAFDRFDAPLPHEALLDTSFVVEALIVSQPLHAAALDFLDRLLRDEVRIRFSAMLDLELAETAFQLALKENHPRDWRRFRHDGRARPRAARLMREVRDAWEGVLAYLPHDRIPIDAIIGDVPRLMGSHGLASYDAVHAATSLLPTPLAIVTTDVGFASLPATTTIFTDSTRVARCREIRSGRH